MHFDLLTFGILICHVSFSVNIICSKPMYLVVIFDTHIHLCSALSFKFCRFITTCFLGSLPNILRASLLPCLRRLFECSLHMEVYILHAWFK